MYGARGRGQQNEPPSANDAKAWLAGRLPDDWFTGAPTVVVDREEITITGTLPELSEKHEDEAERAAAVAGRISRFREQTRDERIGIARQAEQRYQRKVAWAVRLGDVEKTFTSAAVPVMTRLRQRERIVLDTLVSAGVARSRSEALAWAVRLVGEHAESWLAELRQAMEQVDELRDKGPEL